MERETQGHHDLLRVTLQAISDAVVTTDAAGRIEMLNSTAEMMVCWSSSDAVGKQIEEVIELRERRSENHHPNPAYLAIRHGIRVDKTDEFVIVNRDNRRIAVEISATPIQNSAGEMRGCVLVFRDVSQARQMADRMSYLAHHDPLTGLPNRILLVDRLEQGTRMADRNNDRLALMFLDLDRYKEIVEAHGIATSDELLKEASFRLRQALRESDTVCRLGGGEFVVMLPGVKLGEDIEAVAAKLVSEISRGYLLGKSPYETSCSIGVSVYPQDGKDVGTLMRLADGAMYAAKRGGQNQYRFASSASESVDVAPDVEEGL